MFGITEEKVAKWGQKGKSAKLMKAATSGKNNIRLAAIRAMANVNDEVVVNALISALRDRDPEIRMSAIDSLVNKKTHISIEHVRSLVADTDPVVSQKAKDALKELAKGK